MKLRCCIQLRIDESSIKQSNIIKHSISIKQSTEIQKKYPTITTDENIRWFNVSVNNIAAVDVIEHQSG